MQEDLVIADVDTNPFSSAEETNCRAVMAVQEMDDDDTEGHAASEEIRWDSFDTTKPGVLDLILGRMTDTPVRLDASNNIWWYDGRRWLSLAKNEHGLTSRITPELRELRKNALSMPKGGDVLVETMRKELLRSCKALLDNPGKIAKHLKYVACIQNNPIVLDKNPYLLNCRNGVVDLRTGELFPHHPSFGMTGLAAIDYTPGAPCPQFEDFLKTVFSNDTDLIRYVQQVLGYSLSGDTSAQVWWIHYGSSGQNGKSVLSNIIRKLLGDSYVAEIGPQSLTGKSSRISDDIASQNGKRILFCREPEQNMVLNEPLVKSLTGGDSLRVRHLYQRYFDLTPDFKLHMQTNFLPEVNGNSPAAWRRMRVIPFLHRVPDEKRVNGLDAKLVAEEGLGILAWIVEGAKDYFQNGFVEPDAVSKATKQYRNQQCAMTTVKVLDPSKGLAFIHSALTKEPAGDLSKADVYKSYLDDCRDQDLKPVSRKAFGQSMQREGYKHPVVQNHRIFDKFGKSVGAWHGVRYKASGQMNTSRVNNVTSITAASKKSKRDVA